MTKVDQEPQTSLPKISRRSLLKGVLGLGAAAVLPTLPHTAEAAPVKQPIYSGETEGFSVIGPMYEAYQAEGGITSLGPPISQPFKDKQGRLVQVFNQGGIQLTFAPDGKTVTNKEFWNIYDDLADRNLDNLTDLAPNSRNWSSDPKDWGHHRNGPLPGTVEANHINTIFGELDQKGYSQLRQKYFSNPKWFDRFGLPMEWKDYGNVVAVRCNRVLLHLWKDKTDWTSGPMQVVTSNAGLDAKKFGLIPQEALNTQKSTDFNTDSQPVVARQIAEQTNLPVELLSQQEYLQQMQAYSEASGRKDFVNQFKDKMQAVAQGLIVGPGRIIPSQKYPQYTFARDSFWALMTLQDRNFTQQVVDRFKADQVKNSDGHFATALLNDDSIPDKRDRDEESTMMGVLEQYLLYRLGGSLDTNSLSRAYSFIQSHIQNGEYVTNGDNHPEDLGTYHYWADTLRNPRGSVITYNQGLLCVALKALKEMSISVNDSLIGQAENSYRNLANPQNPVVLPQRKGSSIVDISSMVGEALSQDWFNRSILGRDKVLATYNHVINNPTKVTRSDGRFIGFKILSDFQGRFLSPDLFNDANDTPGSYQNGGTWPLYDELLLYAAIRHGAGSQAKELLLQRLAAERLGNEIQSNEFMFTAPGREGTVDDSRKDYGWNTFVRNLLP